MENFKGYEWAEGLSEDELYEQSVKRNLPANVFESLMELNGYPLFDMEAVRKKQPTIVSTIVSWIIGLTILYLAASVFG